MSGEKTEEEGGRKEGRKKARLETVVFSRELAERVACDENVPRIRDF